MAKLSDVDLMRELGMAIENIGTYHTLEFTRSGLLMFRCDLRGKFPGFDYLGEGVYWYSSTKWGGRRHAKRYLRNRLMELRRKDLRQKLFYSEPKSEPVAPKPKSTEKISTGWYQDAEANLYKYDGKTWTDGMKEVDAPKLKDLEYVSK